jgi:tryptophan halogenase
MSSGYVYSSQCLSDDAAEESLRRFWQGKDLSGLNALQVRFETGKLRHTWVANCVAIGLAGGFIEPLESTGLAITQMGIEMAASMLDARCYDDETVARYNAHVDKFYTDIMHFIVAHYCLTSREDTPFWRAARHDTALPDALQQRLEVFRRQLPTSSTRGTTEVFMFRDISWFAVLLGMNFPFAPDPIERSLMVAGQLIRERKRAAVKEGMAKLPNHYRYLRESVYGRPALSS